MGTSFYWKKIPKEIQDLVSDENRYTTIYSEEKSDKDMFNVDDSIFKHIGKRSASGYYCFKCGITFCKKGTNNVHNEGPDISLLLHNDVDDEEAKRRQQEYERQWKKFYFSKCPCCGSDMHDKRNVNASCSFTWTMMLHKKIIMAHIDDPECLIEDEYCRGYTCKEFLEEELDNVVIESQFAWEFE